MSKYKKIELPNESDLEHHPEPIKEIIEIVVDRGQKPVRLDQYLAKNVRNASRTKVQKSIDEGSVKIDGKVVNKPSRKVKPNEKIVCTITKAPPIKLVPQDIPLDIIYEDEYLLVVNKPAGMVTHPGVGNRYGTLVNALIYHLGMRENIIIESDEDEDEDESDEEIFSRKELRPGIVHRLDKNTSGLLVIAKESHILSKLQSQFHDRTVSRTYNAIVWNSKLEDEGRIDADIGRSNLDRKKFAVVKKDGKKAITDYKVIERYPIASLVELKLQTGRTHQIRVHMNHIHHPVFGDETYNGTKMNYHGAIGELKNLAKKALKMSERQMLHARELTFYHPVKEKQMSFSSDLPEDFKELIKLFRDFEE